MAETERTSGTTWGLRLVAFLIAALGAPMAIGGVLLVVRGGSFYYLAAGVLLVFSAMAIWRGKPAGTRLYWLFLAVTALWSFWETGANIWGLLARLGLPTALGLLLGLANGLAHRERSGPLRLRISAAAIGGVTLVLVGVVLIPSHLLSQPARPEQRPQPAGSQWATYGGSGHGTRFSPLSQITPANVADLAPAWSYSTGDDALTARGNVLAGLNVLESTPLQIGDSLYLCTKHGDAIALDAETGKERWRFDPHIRTRIETHSTCRGVSYTALPGQAGDCASRIFLGSLDGDLWAIDALTGRACPGFGAGGRVSLRAGMSNPDIGYHMTSPGAIAGSLIIVGAWVSDNQAVEEPSGVIRAFDTTTGKLAWAWDMGQPDRTGAPDPGQTYTPGTPNAWAPFSVDETLGMVYVPTGNPTPDLWGGRRRPFDERYGSAIVALDIRTGRPRWSFQTTHHDVWDFDLPSQPVLADIPTAGGPRPAVIQATKRGEIFVLDRRDGRPIFPVEERPVPQNPVAGDHLSRTQPFSALAIRDPQLTEAMMWGLTPLDQLWCRIKFREARYEGFFTPLGEKPTINDPGAFGKTSWGGVTVDEQRHILVANNSSVPFYMQLIRRDQAPPDARKRRWPTSYKTVPMEGTPYVASILPFFSPLNVPCSAPPWGHIDAFDLATGKRLWRRVLGSARDNGPLGIRSHLPITIGVPNQGGAMTTASGITFVGASADAYLRAFDTQSGALLWEGRLPAGGQATPMTYISPKSGRQFVVIAASGHAALSNRLGDSVVAFALPQR